jgi:hypothetical protein
MLRRVVCARMGRRVAVAATPAACSSCSVYATATLLSTPRRTFTSRSGSEAKKSTVSTKPSTTAAATAAQVFATNEKGKSSSSSNNGDASNHAQQEQEQQQPQHQQQQEDAVPAAVTPTASGIRSIGIKLSEDDELVRAFNNFSKTVNGCTQEEFLVGVRQAYASLAVVISAFVDKAQQPLVGLTESSKVITAAHEAAKLLEQEFKPENSTAAKTSAVVEGEAPVKAEDAVCSNGSGAASASTATASMSPKAKLQDTLVQHVVSTITSIIPVSKHLAESIFKIWMLQKEKQVNLSSIASPTDYVLDSKLVIFARLDKARIYFNSDNIGAEVDVTLNNDYLRKLDPNVASARGSGGAALHSSSSSSAAKDAASSTAGSKKGGMKAKINKNNAVADKDDDDDLDEGMIQVLTDTTANAQRSTAEEHTFVVDKRTRKLTQKSSPETVKAAKTAAEPAAASKVAGMEGKGSTISRLQVTCVTASESAGAPAPAAPTNVAVATEETKKDGQGEAADPDACSVFIRVNGNALPPIPADARACALLTVDVVVPPERYAYNFEWFYKRIIGYDNEYERIAAARVFASNSPKSLGTFLDFVMRMITGKSVEFMFSKSIGRIIGIPEDVSETPPATRKLMCMYMDASYKWVLADLITLAPVIETKLPKA